MTVSIAMCTYNGELYLEEQLRSIVAQTRMVNEIVICDDGSKDSTIYIIEKFAQEYSITIKLVHNPVNLGYVRNFEKAICACSGDIIFLSDQDDIWLPDKVQVMCDYFDKNPDKSVVFSNAYLVNSHGVRSFNKTLFDVVAMDNANKKLFKTGHQHEVLCTGGRITGCTTAIRASFIPYCIPFPVKNQVHDEIIAVSAMFWDKLDFIDECLICYRQHENQSLGISLLFVYRPKCWELADDIFTWHQKLLEPNAVHAKQKLQFVYRRFWSLRSRINMLRIVYMYIGGEYHKIYPDANRVFLRDFGGIVKRFKLFFKRAQY